MNKLAISEQVRTLRKSKGLSQEALAESAGINLRTLQRIEAGDAIPRGETLRLLARALDVSIQELSELIEEVLVPETEDPGFLKLMNLSALSFWFIPMGNVFVPLGFWLYKRNKITGVAELGKRILNFQITWSIIVYGLTILTMFGAMAGRFFINPFIVICVIFVLTLANTVFIITNTSKITKGEEDIYPTSLKIIQ